MSQAFRKHLPEVHLHPNEVDIVAEESYVMRLRRSGLRARQSAQEREKGITLLDEYDQGDNRMLLIHQ